MIIINTYEAHLSKRITQGAIQKKKYFHYQHYYHFHYHYHYCYYYFDKSDQENESLEMTPPTELQDRGETLLSHRQGHDTQNIQVELNPDS